MGRVLKIIVTLSIALLIVILVCSPVLLTPIKFLKLVSLRPDSDVLIHSQIALDRTVNPSRLISEIPYERGRFVDILPERKYQRSIKGGEGDCSNLTYGLAYWLIEQEIDFAILHMLRVPGFTQGEGHVTIETAVNLNGNNSAAILDLLEGGVLTDGTKLISIRDVFLQKHNEIEVIPFHPSRDTRSAYYERSNLQNTRLGFTPKEQVMEYYNIIEDIYVDLGHRVLERYIFDTIALLLGKYPRIHLQNNDYQHISEIHGTSMWLSHGILWFARFTMIIVIVFLMSTIFHRGKLVLRRVWPKLTL